MRHEKQWPCSICVRIVFTGFLCLKLTTLHFSAYLSHPWSMQKPEPVCVWSHFIAQLISYRATNFAIKNEWFTLRFCSRRLETAKQCWLTNSQTKNKQTATKYDWTIKIKEWKLNLTKQPRNTITAFPKLSEIQHPSPARKHRRKAISQSWSSGWVTFHFTYLRQWRRVKQRLHRWPEHLPCCWHLFTWGQQSC